MQMLHGNTELIDAILRDPFGGTAADARASHRLSGARWADWFLADQIPLRQI